jgi:hypothetical protein
LHSFCLFVGRRLAARRDSDSFSTCKAHEQTIGQHSHGRIRGAGGFRLPGCAEVVFFAIKAAVVALGERLDRSMSQPAIGVLLDFWVSAVGHIIAAVVAMSPLAIIALPAHEYRPVSFTGDPLQLARNGSIEPGLSGLSDGGRMREPARWS